MRDGTDKFQIQRLTISFDSLYDLGMCGEEICACQELVDGCNALGVTSIRANALEGYTRSKLTTTVLTDIAHTLPNHPNASWETCELNEDSAHEAASEFSTAYSLHGWNLQAFLQHGLPHPVYPKSHYIIECFETSERGFDVTALLSSEQKRKNETVPRVTSL